MTIPTQAQIEAAAKAMFLDDYDGEGYSWNHPDRAEQKQMYVHKAEIALTAAAGVSEPMQIRDARNFIAIRNAEREACAQVADNMQLYTAWDIAAAIRARKT